MFFMFLEVRQLDVHYPGRAQAAVRGASFGLRAGEIGVLIGPSGCGKTTLLRAVAGLEPVSAGEIRLGGEVVSRAGSTLAPELRRIGMVSSVLASQSISAAGRSSALRMRRRWAVIARP